jgi:hypothetical protein
MLLCQEPASGFCSEPADTILYLHLILAKVMVAPLVSKFHSPPPSTPPFARAVDIIFGA